MAKKTFIEQARELKVLVSLALILIGATVAFNITYATNSRVDLVTKEVKLVVMRLDEQILNDRKWNIREQMDEIEEIYACEFTDEKSFCIRNEVINLKHWKRYRRLTDELQKIEVQEKEMYK